MTTRMLDPGMISSLATEIYISRVALVATSTILVYDYLLTFDDETELVWKSRFSIVKLLFLLNRYSAFIGVFGLTYVFVSFPMPDHSMHCRPFFWIFGGFVISEYLFAELILYTRAYAIYGRKRVALVLLGGAALASWTAGGYFAVRFVKTATVIPGPFFPSGCVISLEGFIDMLGFIALVASETVALFALLIRVVQIPNSMTLKRLSADGIMFYIAILFASTANLIVLNVAPPAVCNFMIAPQAALHSICCNRLILSLRRTAALRLEEVTETFPISPSSYSPTSACTRRNGIELQSLPTTLK